MSLKDVSCNRKIGYRSDEAARLAIAAYQAKRPGTFLRIYRCQFCRLRHLTSSPPDRKRSAHLRAMAGETR